MIPCSRGPIPRLAWLSTTASLLACSPARAGDSPEPSSIEMLRQDVLSIVGEPLCQATAECRAAPMGVKPCGGPRSYIIYSTSSTDSVDLEAAVARFDSLDSQRNRELGLMSDCQFIPQPTPMCRAGTCSASIGGRNDPQLQQEGGLP